MTICASSAAADTMNWLAAEPPPTAPFKPTNCCVTAPELFLTAPPFAAPNEPMPPVEFARDEVVPKLDPPSSIEGVKVASEVDEIVGDKVVEIISARHAKDAAIAVVEELNSTEQSCIVRTLTVMNARVTAA